MAKCRDGYLYCIIAICISLLSTFGVSDRANAAATCTTLEQFGGSGNGTTDNSSAWTAALSAIGTTNGCIQLGPGTYRSSTAVNITLSSTASQSISLFGMGPRTTTVYFPNATDGFVVSLPLITNGFNFSGMTIATGQTGGRIGLNITSPCFGTGPGTGNFGTGPQRLIDNVDFRGNDSLTSTNGLGNQYWSTGLQIINASFFNIRALTSYGPQSTAGSGVVVTGSGANCGALIYNINGANIQRQQTGIQYGNAVQGVTVAQSNFVLNTTDISCPSTSSNLDQLTIASSQFDTTGTSISISCPLNDVIISGNLFFLQGMINSIVLSGSSGRYAITGNNFVQQGGGSGNGINVFGAANAGIISGNLFSGLSTGVILGSSSQNFSVQANVYPSTTTKVGNAGTGNVVGGGTP